MKPLLQKLPLNGHVSFVANTFRTPNFEVGWHQHIEYELILFTEGYGSAFIGNHVGEFDTGDIFFLGSNLPHTFQKREQDLVTSAVVVQFLDNFWGSQLLQLPESRMIRQLFEASMHGLKLQGESRKLLAPMIRQLETTFDFRRVLLLGECLQLMATQKEYIEVSTQEFDVMPLTDQECIERVLQFTKDSFMDPISLPQVAAIACMSVPAFCKYFKRSTKKTYIDFLNEVRIGHACTLLQETHKAVLDICYESGYNTMGNFHKQFLKIKQVTPLQYRKMFEEENISKGSNIGIEESL